MDAEERRRLEESLWLREVEAARRVPPPAPETWVLQFLAFLAALAVIDGLTFYGLYLLGCLLHKVIFG